MTLSRMEDLGLSRRFCTWSYLRLYTCCITDHWVRSLCTTGLLRACDWRAKVSTVQSGIKKAIDCMAALGASSLQAGKSRFANSLAYQTVQLAVCRAELARTALQEMYRNVSGHIHQGHGAHNLRFYFLNQWQGMSTPNNCDASD